MANDPKDLTITNTVVLDHSALEAAIRLQVEEPDYTGLPLRLYLDGKGCDGFYYGVTFAEQTPDDIVFQQDPITIIVDPDTIEFVQGSTITWVDDERGRGFLVNNPNHRKFRGKFYKKRAWQERLAEKNAAVATPKS